MNARGRSSHRLLTLAAIWIVSAAAAAAQTPPPPASDWGRPGARAQGPQAWQAERAKMQERRLAELHTKLNLKPGQEPAWQAFVTGLQAARPAPKPHDRPDRDTMMMDSAPQRLDRMLARIDEMRGRLVRLDQTVKAFYAGLSKDQQTIFDDNFRFKAHGPGGPGGWGRAGMGRGPQDHRQMDGGQMGPGPMGHGPMSGGAMDPPGMSPRMGPDVMGGPPPR